MPKRVLITCPSVSERSGLELFVTEIASELTRRGWEPTIFAPTLGPLAKEMQATGLKIVPELSGTERPDLIHGTFYFETILACLLYPYAPLLYQTHSGTIWQAFPPKIGNLRKVLSVSQANDHVLVEAGFPIEVIVRSFNFADTRKFLPRPPLPDVPRRALVFSNYAAEGNYLDAVREACSRAGLELDVVGTGVRAPCAHPERILANYDVVFARGRAAIEAMVVGCAVIPCNTEGAADIVTMHNVQQYRALNFGYKVLNRPTEPEYLLDQLRGYDPEEARRVMLFMRREGSLERAMVLLETQYTEAMNAPSMGYSYGDLLTDFDRYMMADMREAENASKYSPTFRACQLVRGLLAAVASTPLADLGRENA